MFQCIYMGFVRVYESSTKVSGRFYDAFQYVSGRLEKFLGVSGKNGTAS